MNIESRPKQRIAPVARHDSLTGLPNRIMIKERLDSEVARFHIAHQDFAVLLIDLDRFKFVNDTFGHSAGGSLLELVGERLLNIVPSTAKVARLGGVEFAILYLNALHDAELQEIAQEIIRTIEEPFILATNVAHVGASIGYVRCDRGNPSAETMIRCADIALYQAKAAGRGTFCAYEAEMDKAPRAKLEFERDLRAAVQDNALKVHYQPIVDLATGVPKSMEALVRWHHAVRGNVPPSDFIPVAEENGLIHAIGQFVLETACRDACAWPDSINVAINVSPLQFQTGDCHATVMQALTNSGLSPKRLELEITESLLMEASQPSVAWRRCARWEWVCPWMISAPATRH